MEWMILPLKRYAEFSGRSQRKEYWMFALFNTLVYLAFAIVIMTTMNEGAFGADGGYDANVGVGMVAGFFLILAIIYVLAIFIPALAVAVRRFHDQGKSGWFYLLSFIPYVGGIIFLVFMCLDGTKGENEYGQDPKGVDFDGVF